MATVGKEQTTSRPLVKITEMDHIVLKVRDMDASLSFYHEVLGLKVERLEEYRAGKVGFPSVRLNQDTIIDLSSSPDMPPLEQKARNMDHFCMVVEPMDLDSLVADCDARGIQILQKGQRWGAHGMATSIYIQDPDSNTIELRWY